MAHVLDDNPRCVVSFLKHAQLIFQTSKRKSTFEVDISGNPAPDTQKLHTTSSLGWNLQCTVLVLMGLSPGEGEQHFSRVAGA